MKKSILLFFVTTLILTNFSGVLAQDESLTPTTPPASPSATTKEDKEIKDLKDRLVKAVETRMKDQKAFSGYAIVKDGAVSFKDDDGTLMTVKIDDTLTKVYQVVGATKKEIKASDIKSGSYIIITGPQVDKTVNANYIYVDEAFLVASGKITEVNKTDYYIKVMAPDKQEYTLDIENRTKQNMLNIKTLEIESTGFSKIKEGDTVHFSASKDESKSTSAQRFAAQKILVIPQEYFMK